MALEKEALGVMLLSVSPSVLSLLFIHDRKREHSTIRGPVRRTCILTEDSIDRLENLHEPLDASIRDFPPHFNGNFPVRLGNVVPD